MVSTAATNRNRQINTTTYFCFKAPSCDLSPSPRLTAPKYFIKVLYASREESQVAWDLTFYSSNPLTFFMPSKLSAGGRFDTLGTQWYTH